MLRGELLPCQGYGQAASEVFESYLEEGPSEDSLPEIPPSLAELLKSCFQQNPDERPKDMQQVADELRNIYRQTVGKAYFRQSPLSVESLASDLNNRALSLLDLGRRDRAIQEFDRALQADPQHLEARYNSGLLQWRSGTSTYESLVRQLQDISETRQRDWKPLYLVGQLHMERGDAEAAAEILAAAEGLATENAVIGTRPETCARRRREMAAMHQEDANFGTPFFLGRARFVRDGNTAIVADNSSLALYDVALGNRILTLTGHTDVVWSIDVARDGNRAISSGNDGTLRVWDLREGVCEQVVPLEEPRVVRMSPTGSHAVSNDWQRLILWDLRQGRALRSWDSIGHPTCVSVAWEAGLIVSGTYDGPVEIWPLTGKERLRTLEGHQGEVWSVGICRDGTRAVSSGKDGILRIWDLRGGLCMRCISPLRELGSTTYSVSLSPDEPRSSPVT